MAKKKYPTGRFSNEEKRSIPIWKKQGLTVEEISERVNHSPIGVRKLLDEMGYVEENEPALKSDATIIKTALRKKPYWKKLQEQFTKGELEEFEDLWVRMMMEQFRQDLLPAEELQVKQLLTLYILIDRSLVERQQMYKEIGKIQRELDKEYGCSIDNRDMSRIDHLESRLSYAKSSVSNHTTEHAKWLEKIEKINKDLKATRDQHVKRIEDAKTSFIGLIRALEDEEFRKRMGQEAELMNVAKDNVRDKLSEWHEYGTNTDYAEMDVPFLNAETIMNHDDI